MGIEMGTKVNESVYVEDLTDEQVRVVLGLLIEHLGLHLRLTNQTPQCLKHGLLPELALLTEEEAYQ